MIPIRGKNYKIHCYMFVFFDRNYDKTMRDVRTDSFCSIRCLETAVLQKAEMMMIPHTCTGLTFKARANYGFHPAITQHYFFRAGPRSGSAHTRANFVKPFSNFALSSSTQPALKETTTTNKKK